VSVKSLPLHVERLPAPPIDNVCDRLYEWAPAYRQRREDLQLLQQENESTANAQEHPGRPAINPLSSDLAKNLKPISERYKGIMWMKEFSLQRDREKRASDSIKSYTWRPDIHPKSKKLDRGITSLYRWKKKIDSRNEVMRQRKFELETVNCTFVPPLGATSRRLAANQETTGNQSVHDRLYVDAQKRRFAQDLERQAAAHRFAACTKTGGKAPAKGGKTARSAGSSRSGSPKRGAGLEKSASARSMPSAPPPASQVIRGLNAERGRGVKFSASASSPSLDGRAKSRAVTPDSAREEKSPRSLRGPRASMAVLPRRDGEQESSRRRKWKKARTGQGSGSSRSVASGSTMGEGGKMTARSMIGDMDEDEYEMPKSVWTGGSNTITIEAPYEDLLSQCAPDPPGTGDTHRRGR